MTITNDTMSVYHRGAADGALFGAYLSLMFLFSAMSMTVPILSMAGTLMALIVPGITYFAIKRGDRLDGYTSSFSGLWLHGILMFLCGSLIMALVMYVFMRFIRPNFIVSNLREVIDIYQNIDSPETKTIAHDMQQLIDRKMVPSSISVATTMVWFGSFSGSILSLIVALIVKATRPRDKRQ